LQKALLDALQHGGAYRDDAQIDDLHIRRCACVPDGRVRVQLTVQPEPEPPAVEDTPAKPGTCLKCGAFFHSRGPGNRICSPCRRENNRLDLGEAEVRRQRGVKRHNGEILEPDQQC
jgi:hypothetical protein